MLTNMMYAPVSVEEINQVARGIIVQALRRHTRKSHSRMELETDIDGTWCRVKFAMRRSTLVRELKPLDFGNHSVSQVWPWAGLTDVRLLVDLEGGITLERQPSLLFPTWLPDARDHKQYVGNHYEEDWHGDHQEAFSLSSPQLEFLGCACVIADVAEGYT